MSFQMIHRRVGLTIAAGVLSVLCISIATGVVQDASGATTSAAKTYWHKVGNDRFRAYDVTGNNGNPPPWQQVMGLPPYPLFSKQQDVNREANKNYARRVDWPVNFIFRNNASISRVKDGLNRQGLDSTGGAMFLSLSDAFQQWNGNDYVWWDEDRGLKEHACSGLPIPGKPHLGLQGSPRETNHIRLYADSLGVTPGTRDDKLYNPYWGFYVLGTSHIDYRECAVLGDTWFGESELAEYRIAGLARREWGGGQVAYSGYDMKNFEQRRREGDHIWNNDGWATVVRVGPMASGSTNPPDDDPNPEGPENGGGGEGEEGPPPPDPAIESDVNGDDHADLVALHTSGVAHTYNALDAADTSTPFGGGMNSALFDGSEHHVIDVADVNADGHSDLITLCFKSPIGIENAVCVYPGKADNSFGDGILARGNMVPGTLGPNGHEPIGVADVTGDLRGDLVTFYAPQGNFYVFPGLENGQFGDGLSGGGGQINSALFDRHGTYFVDVADVNGDGHADITGLSTSGSAQVFPGTPWGIHQAPMPVGPTVEPIMADGSGHEPIGAADVNGDGKSDLVTLDPSGSIAVYGGMHEPTQYFVTSATTSLHGQNSSLMDEAGDDFVGLMDRTGDGKADLVKVTAEGVVYVAPGQEDLKFGAFAYFRNGVTPNRFGKSGYEQVSEKPFIRRIGCSPAGCIDRPRAMESDVDADLRSDLVTLDSAGTSHVFRGVGDVGHTTSFAGTMNQALFDGTGLHVIDVADVTGDWRADKVALHDNGNVYVYPGKFDGTFDTGVATFAGLMTPGPYSPSGFEPIAVADVAGDAKADLVVFKQGVGVKVYPGKADGTFGSGAVSLSTANSALFDQTGYHFLDVVDVNGDRRGDLVVSGAQDDTIRVFKGNSNGTFILDGVSRLPLKLDEGPGQELVGLADINGDGRADLATLAQGTVYVFEGTASGEFATEDAAGPSPTATSLSGSLDSNLFDQAGGEIVGLLDENGDRKADLVTIVAGGGSARIFQGRANFTFNPTFKANNLPGLTSIRFKKLPGQEMVTEKPAALRAGCTSSDCPWPPVDFAKKDGDVDGDYRADLVAVDGQGDAHVFAGARTGVLAESAVSLEGQIDSALLDGKGHYLVDIADVNDNGNSDLVTVKDDGKVLVHPGKGDRTFGTAVETGISLPPKMNGAGSNEPVAVADVTGDGYGDLVAYTGSLESNRVAVYKGQPDGKFNTTGVQSIGGSFYSALSPGGTHHLLDVIDVDGDELADLVTIGYSSAVYVHKGQADGKFAAAVTAGLTNPILNDGVGAEPIGLGDVTADGRADLVTHEGSTLKIWNGKSDATFAAPVTAYGPSVDSALLDGTGEELLGLLDYDGDGRADLIASNDSGDILTYKAQSDGKFAAPLVVEGDIASVKRDEDAGHEFVLERPFQKRVRCFAEGCPWPRVQRNDDDVDGDGRADLVTLHTNGSVYAYGGRSSGIDFETAGTSFSGSMDPALFDGEGDFMDDVADVDGDGRGDLVTQTEQGDVFVHRGKPDRTFGTAVAAYGIDGELDEVEPIAVADVNGDHRADLVQYATEDAEGLVLVAPGLADGTFSDTADTISLQGAANSALRDKAGEYFVDAMDVTGDDRADLVSMGTSGTVRLYKGQADGKFAAGIDAAAGVNPSMDEGLGNEPIGLGDITGEGRADLIAIGAAGLVKLYAGQADGTFTAFTNAHPSGSIDSSLLDGIGRDLVGVLDYNGDGLADLVTTSKSGVVKIHKAMGDGTFSFGTLQNGSLTPNRFAVSPAEQLVNEKPFLRRAGCTPTGCSWPPTPAAEPPEPEPSEWSATPLGKEASHLDDVWCGASWECLAVGDVVTDSGALRAQVSHWDGNAWTASSPIETAEGRWTELSGVTCVSSECIAVGRSYDESAGVRALVLKGDGSSWDESTVPNPAESKASKLIEISCASASLCMAVGSYIDAADVRRTLALRWNGSQWSISPTPSSNLPVPPGYYLASASELTDVSCPTTTMCAAVGTFVDYDTGTTKALGLEWDGSTWTVAPAPGMGGSTPRELSGVSCVGPSSCVAVGSYTASSGEKRNWALDWDGTDWGSSGAPNPTSEGTLTAVTCSGSACSASGSSRVASGMRPTVLEWDDSAWTWEDHLLDLPGGAASAELAAIACVGSECNAVGSVRYGDSESRNVGYAFDGTAGSVTDTGGSGGAMSGVSCSSASDCVATGSAAMPLDAQDLSLGWVLAAEKWQASATADVSNPALGDVSCTSATACTAVGTQTPGWPPNTLAERWDGSAWDDQATPNPGGGGNLSLNGVSCYAANGCVSAGWYSQSGRILPLAQSWNGSAWSSMSVPTPSGTPASTMLLDVACTAASSCFGVGSSSASGNLALVEHWNGSAWSVQSASLPSGAVGATLRGISCTSTSACTAVGTYQTNPGWTSHPLVLRWNGSAWSVQLSAPPAGATKATINDVSCYSATGCVAVGDYSTTSASLPLAMRWDGSSWTLETTAQPAGDPHVYLESVSCPTEGSCKAVGKAQFDSGHSELYALESE